MIFCEFSFGAFASPCSIKLEAKSRLACQNIASAVHKEAKRLEQKYSFFDPNSYLNQINHRTTDTVNIDVETATILREVLLRSKQTGYAFDIAFAGTLKERLRAKTLSEFDELTQALTPYAIIELFSIDGNKISFSNTYTKLDLGGVIKEYALDSCVKILRRHKIKNALLNFAGDIFALGSNGDRAWRIGIKNPEQPSEDITTIELTGKSITTSGHYERSILIDEKVFSYIQTSSRCSSNISQASVVGDSAFVSGIFSTALLIDSTIKIPQGYGSFLVDKNNQCISYL